MFKASNPSVGFIRNFCLGWGGSFTKIQLDVGLVNM